MNHASELGQGGSTRPEAEELSSGVKAVTGCVHRAKMSQSCKV